MLTEKEQLMHFFLFFS